MNYQVPETILQQLGGKRFMVMTGSKVDNVTEISILLKLGCGAKVTKFEVILKPDDTYTVNLIAGTGVRCRVIKKIDSVYCDSLVEVFERETGFYTSF